MKDIKTLTKDVERDLVIGIVISVKHKRRTLKESEKIAKEFLEGKVESYEELFQKLFELGRKYSEIRRIYVKYAPEFELMKQEEALKIMRRYIKIKDFEAAIEYGRKSYGH